MPSASILSQKARVKRMVSPGLFRACSWHADSRAAERTRVVVLALVLLITAWAETSLAAALGPDGEVIPGGCGFGYMSDGFERQQLRMAVFSSATASLGTISLVGALVCRRRSVTTKHRGLRVAAGVFFGLAALCGVTSLFTFPWALLY